MYEYAAFLGHQPKISIAELASILPDFSLLNHDGRDILFFNTSKNIDQNFLNMLGGTIVIARRLTELLHEPSDIPALLVNELSPSSKQTFALRCISLPRKVILHLYKDCKLYVKERGYSVRYTSKDHKPVAPVVLHDEQMLTDEKGCELTIILMHEGLWVGKTVGAQNVHAYTKRDIHKPVRDTTTGLLPPKLAQILINFGVGLIKKQVEDTVTVYDPFCGTGVIPIECLLRKYKLFASDFSDTAVTGCKKNLEWVTLNYVDSSSDYTVWKHDATTGFDKSIAPDIIVTETSLGTPQTHTPSMEQITEERYENEKLQQLFLQNARESFSDCPVVCTWPVWFRKKEEFRLQETYNNLSSLGYTPVLPVNLTAENQNRVSLLYHRSSQFVGREILILKPN